MHKEKLKLLESLVLTTIMYDIFAIRQPYVNIEMSE